MGFFDNVQEDKNLEVEVNRLGGYQPIKSGIYKGKIDMAYGTVSKNGAKGLVLDFKLIVDGKERVLSETFWFTTRDGKTFSIKSDGTRQNLRGYNQAQALCTLLINKGVLELTTQERPIKIKEETKMVPVCVELLDKPVALAVFEVEENAVKKQPDGTYAPFNDKRKNNEISDIFNEKGFCYTEVKAGAEEPKFALAWKEKWEGQIKNNFKEVKNTSSEASGEEISFG